MAETVPEKKSTNPLVFVGVGCLVLIVLFGLGSAVVGKFFAKKFIQGAIESKTGIKTNLSDIENGKMTFTDSKTGAKVDVGTNKVPDNFPKEFPIYPGSKVASSLAGAQSGKNNGFWLTLTTGDSLDKVVNYYKGQLAAGGWEVSSTYAAGNSWTQSVTKGVWNGSVAVTQDTNSKETQIVIILGQDNSPTTPATQAPSDTSGNSGSGY